MGFVDQWLTNIRKVRDKHSKQLDEIKKVIQLNRLCELNVMRQVRNVASDVFVQDAWARGQKLSVHGWVYALENGLIRDLKVAVSG